VALAESAAALIRALSEFGCEPSGRLTRCHADFWESPAENASSSICSAVPAHLPSCFYLVLRIFGRGRIETTVPTEPGRQPYTTTIFDRAGARRDGGSASQSVEKAYHWKRRPASVRALPHSTRSRASPPPLAPTARALPCATAPSRPRGGVAKTYPRASLFCGRPILDRAYYRLGFEVLLPPYATAKRCHRSDPADPGGSGKPALSHSLALKSGRVSGRITV
jgi:hypothetical protein